ncbi:MAG: hypothetical protein ACLFPF_08925 [Halanaerobiales bacterium]
MAGAGGGGTIIALTLEPEKTRQALTEAGAETVLGLDSTAYGISINPEDDLEDEAAATAE